MPAKAKAKPETAFAGLSLERTEDGQTWKAWDSADAAKRLANSFVDLSLVREMLLKGEVIRGAFASYRQAAGLSNEQEAVSPSPEPVEVR